MIELEDSFLHEDMPLLVWCMGVSDFEYSNEILESILQIVSDLACVEYSDVLEETTDVDVFRLWKDSDVLVRSILIRGFYRGMAGDVKMLQEYAAVWHERLKRPEWKEVLTVAYRALPLWTLEEVKGKFCMADAVLEGIDFHCSNMIENLMDNPQLALTLEPLITTDIKSYLHSAIWNQRSKYNIRKNISLLAQSFQIQITDPTEITPEDLIYTRHIKPLVDLISLHELHKRFA